MLSHEKNEGKGAAILTGFMAASHVAITRSPSTRTDSTIRRRLASDRRHPAQKTAGGGRSARRHGRRRGAHIPWTSGSAASFQFLGSPLRRSGRFGFAKRHENLSAAGSPEPARTGAALPVRSGDSGAGAKKAIPVFEAPISVLYSPDGTRISHFRPFVDFLRNAKTFTRLIFDRIFHRY